MKKRYFTLVELLVVVGIVVILAGLVLPAVIGGAQQGRITQAKSDMKAIQMALAQMDQTYGKMVRTTGSAASYWTPAPNSSGAPSASDAVNVDLVTKSDNDLGSGASTTNIVLGATTTDGDSTVTSTQLTNASNAYKSLIAELTGMGRSGSGTITYNTNVRKIKFLDPKENFDPAINYNAQANDPYLWLDPWGHQYVVMICTDGSDRIIKPTSWVNLQSSGRYVMGKTAIYSYGPNGENDLGQNASEGGTKLQDDIATWHK
ncbi:MAG: hypothetical protein IJV93_09400 [Lentisphaeria bacterium]|nr:hypothetical protein [Lentisphaeria bacterium]